MCPHAWKLKYKSDMPWPLEEDRMFFSGFGSLMHKLLEQYYSGKASAAQLKLLYITSFQKEVPNTAPSQKMYINYFKDGLRILDTLSVPDFQFFAVEQRFDFLVFDKPFVGIVDLIAERNGKLVIIDHKSRALKERSTRKKPTKTDEELDVYLRQLYLYSIPILDTFGRYPDELCFHCFRKGLWINEPFKEEKLQEAKTWAFKSIQKIEAEKSFPTIPEFFKCHYLCGMHGYCDLYNFTYGKEVE